MRKFIQLMRAAVIFAVSDKIILNSNVDSRAIVRRKCRVYHSSIGPNTYITRNCLLQNVDIGKFCSISENCYIGMPSHPTQMVSTSPLFLAGRNYFGRNYAEIPWEDCPRTKIGNDVWLGLGVVIKAGITIGDGAVIGACSVVTHDIPPYAIVGGVPAKLIRMRFDKETIEDFHNLKWWDWDDSQLIEMGNKFQTPQKFITCPKGERKK